MRNSLCHSHLHRQRRRQVPDNGPPAKALGQTARSPSSLKSQSSFKALPQLWHGSDPAIARLCTSYCKAYKAYSSPKVIHRWRGARTFSAPQPTVNNFGGGAKMLGEQHTIELNPKVEHAGSGRRIQSSNVSTFCQRRSRRDPAPCRQGTLRTLRLPVPTGQRRTSISASIRQGRRAQPNPT